MLQWLTMATDDTVVGTAPATVNWTEGDQFTLPLNRQLFKEGYTLTAWNDGTTDFAPGAEYTPKADVTFTPVFTANTVALADRTEAVTIKWDFQRKNGAPILAYQGTTGIYVAQAQVNGETIDVKLDFDTTNGKLANANWTDWAQMNAGTIFTIPSAKGAVVSMEAYSDITTTTIDGQTDYAQAKTISYTIASGAETVDIVIGDGSYYRYIQTTLPVVESGMRSARAAAAHVDRTLEELKSEFAKFTSQDAIFIFVTNEIGSGGVSDNEIQRKFTDVEGWMNQFIAAG